MRGQCVGARTVCAARGGVREITRGPRGGAHSSRPFTLVRSLFPRDAQFFGIVISLYAILLDRTKQVAATGLLSVLTVSTFLSLHEHFFGLVPLIYRQLNANGVYAAGPSHFQLQTELLCSFCSQASPGCSGRCSFPRQVAPTRMPLSAAHAALSAQATFRNQENRGHITVFAGLVVCAVSNALLTLTIADPVEEVEESPAQDADPSEA